MSEEDHPLISVIITTYYRDQELKKAIQSVKNSEYENIEILVVDDSGESYAEPIIQDYPNINYIELDENKGANKARSIGIKNASGSYIQLLDDDDEIISGKLRKQIDILQKNEETGVAYCGQVFKSKTVALPDENGKGDVLELVLAGELTKCVTSTLLIDGLIAREVIPFPDSPGADDMYIKIELAKETQFEFVDEALIIRGDSDDARGVGTNALKGMAGLLEEYSELYQNHPATVKQTLLANLFHRRAQHELSNRMYSIIAIYWFFLSIWYYPGINISYCGRCLGSIFGRPGVYLVEYIYNMINNFQ